MSTPSLLNIPYLYKAGTLYSQIPESGAGDFTVSRTTTVANRSTRINKDGFIETVLDNVPRLDYPLGGAVNGCPALLVEPSATNLLTRSQQLDHGDWARGAGVNVIGNVSGIIAPDGSQTASLITATTQSLVIGINQNGKTVPTGSPNTKSVYLRGVVGGESVRLRDPNQTIGTTTCVLTTSWQRFTLTETQTGGVGGLWITNIPSGGIYAWGAQLEANSVPTSYIPTTTAAVTRSADVITNTAASALIGQSEGTLYAEVDVRNFGNVGMIASISNATYPNRLEIYKFTDGKIYFDRLSATQSALTSVGSTATYTAPTILKIAVGYRSGDTIMYINGVAATAQQTQTFTFATLTKANIGSSQSDGSILNDRIRNWEIYPNRIPNTAAPGVLSLATLTAL